MSRALLVTITIITTCDRSFDYSRARNAYLTNETSASAHSANIKYSVANPQLGHRAPLYEPYEFVDALNTLINCYNK